MTPEQIANYKVDRSKWEPGPWDGEPDRVDFKHAGLPCLLLRHANFGHWCAYAGVPPGHPLHGKNYSLAYDSGDNDELLDPKAAALLDKIEVHGGITYAAACSHNVCHVPEPGEPDEVWWFGADFHHSGDHAPTRTDRHEWHWRPGADESYKGVSYVQREAEKLAEQLAAMQEVAR